MPNLFRTLDDKVWKASDTIPFELADGTVMEGVWAGSAQEEKLDWWLRNPGSKLAQTEAVSSIASKAKDTGEMVWGEAPAGARVPFVLLAPETGKNYWLAKMVTTEATPAQVAWFRHDRAALFGTLQPDGSIAKISPLEPPPPKPPAPPAQPELF